MSAAEKLKALDDGCASWDEGEPWHDGMEIYIEDGQPPIAALRNALPQIVAVVEAAENVPMWPAAGTKLPCFNLHAALAALDEALT